MWGAGCGRPNGPPPHVPSRLPFPPCFLPPPSIPTPLQVLTAVEDFGAVNQSLAQQGLKLQAEASGLVYSPLVQQEVDDEAFEGESSARVQHCCMAVWYEATAGWRCCSCS